jgi:hypothetical protein
MRTELNWLWYLLVVNFCVRDDYTLDLIKTENFCFAEYHLPEEGMRHHSDLMFS